MSEKGLGATTNDKTALHDKPHGRRNNLKCEQPQQEKKSFRGTTEE